MEENKNQRSSEQDQLRNETTNEAIRNTGNTPNQNNQSQQENIEDSSGRSYDYGTSNDRTSTDASDLTSSSNRSGNTDLSNSTTTGSGHDTITHRGADLTTKKSVTGSDFDGQAS